MTGDYEIINEFWKDRRYENGIDVCEENVYPIDAECRDITTKLHFDDYPFGFPYIANYCDPNRGFLCIDNDDTAYDECPDFEVRFCCPIS